MSPAKHTPGPWQVNHNDPTQVCDADGVVRGCAPVAHCSIGTASERKANARLIAAAPDLLKALIDLVGTMCSASGSDLEDDLDAIDARVGDARAAIARATGDSK
jgi:hypothetical protein